MISRTTGEFETVTLLSQVLATTVARRTVEGVGGKMVGSPLLFVVTVLLLLFLTLVGCLAVQWSVVPCCLLVLQWSVVLSFFVLNSVY